MGESEHRARGPLELADLARLLSECAGDSEGIDMTDPAVLDQDWVYLNYDSISLIQTTSRIERDYDVQLDEEELGDADTPRRYLEMINAALSARAGV
ncbi:acyl carrier protein [Streptomyces antimicrobicus]|uniref:Phosphopantetheine-binding protein n=1 Tax=Streptomyces antimicrobicus TaxID=2883108 RepID=A0ABS8B1X7_9ACTN|nr:phosphopantetheine-binding protein [Streptomyces antimicrobicus]MCB5178577.1 phosphopantetheine-binding protein [Streptomyces antimicrobicus]